MSISTYKVTKKSAHIQVFSLDMCRLNYGLSLYRDFFSALPKTGAGVCLKIIERAVLLCFLDVFDDGVDDEFYIVVGDPWAAGEA